MEYQGRFEVAEKLYHRILAFRPDFVKASVALSTLGEKSPPGTGTGVALSPKDRAQVACDILEPLVEKYPEISLYVGVKLYAERKRRNGIRRKIRKVRI